MLHFGLPAADIIAHPTQPFALSHLHAAGSVDRQARSAIMAEQRWTAQASTADEDAIIERCGRRESSVEEAPLFPTRPQKGQLASPQSSSWPWSCVCHRCRR